MKSFCVFLAALWVLGANGRLPASDAQRAMSLEFMGQVQRGEVPQAELCQKIQDLLQSEKEGSQKWGVRLAFVAGKQLAGSPAVDKLIEYFHVAPNVDIKFYVADALSRTADPRVRPFFRELVRSREPMSARIVAAGHLMANMDMLRDECEAIVSALLEGLNYAAATEARSRPSETEQAWGTLINMVGLYRLPKIMPADNTCEARERAARDWWQRERDAVILRMPKGPKLLKIGFPYAHAAYDWDEGIATICELIASKDENKCRKGIGMAVGARKQLAGTSVVDVLQTAASTWAKTGASSSALTVRQRILTALATIDDPASRPWFVKQLGPSLDVGLRLLSAQYLSANMQADEAEAIVQVVCDVATIDDDHPRYGGRTLEGVRRIAGETILNVAKTKEVAPVTVDWQQDSAARVKHIRDWWNAHKNQPDPQTQGS